MSEPTDEQLRIAIKQVFKKYDVDSNNTLDVSEVKKLINDALSKVHQGREATTEEVNKFMNVCDKDKNQTVSEDELLEIFKKIVNSKK